MAGESKLQNVAGFWVNDSEMGAHDSTYDTASDEPSDTGNYGLSGGKTMLRGALTLHDEARAGYDRLSGLSIEGAVNLNDATRLRMRGGFVEGATNVAALAAFIMEGVHAQGGLVIVAGAAPICTFDGGHYMGAVDASGRLTRTAGN
jgi:hypothetical protein